MIKLISGLVFAAVLLGAILYGVKLVGADQGQLIGYAVGAPDAQQKCELQVVVGLMATAADPPMMRLPNGKPDWNAWLAGHLVVHDASGQVVLVRKGGFRSTDIKERDAQSAEFIALATLDAGQTYDVTYVPILAKPKRYTRRVEAAATPLGRAVFAADY